MMVVERLIEAAASLRDDVDPMGIKLVSEGRIDVCYNPLSYAWDVHVEYLRKMGGQGARTVMLGMNPGPHGMGQMGIPFSATSIYATCWESLTSQSASPILRTIEGLSSD